MRGLLRLVTVTAIVMVIGSAGLATPLVEYLSFNPGTFEYTYQVTLGTSDTLDEFKVNAWTWNATAYSMAAPYTVAGSGGDWNIGRTYHDGTYRSYRWFFGEGQPGWIGQFTLTIQGSHPQAGQVITVNEGATQVITHDLMVPSVIPEPGSLTALGGMLLAIAPIVKRLRKK